MEQSLVILPPQSALNDLSCMHSLRRSLPVFRQGLAGEGAAMRVVIRVDASLLCQYQFEVRLSLCRGTLLLSPFVQRQLAQLLL